MNRLIACIAAACTLSFMGTLAGCYSEGHSHFLADGEVERFHSLSRCEAQATARHSDGSPKYSGYICKEKLVGFTLEVRSYANGKPESVIK